jgi:hypothetical protein
MKTSADTILLPKAKPAALSPANADYMEKDAVFLIGIVLRFIVKMAKVTDLHL